MASTGASANTSQAASAASFVEAAKRKAAFAAVDEYVKDNMVRSSYLAYKAQILPFTSSEFFARFTAPIRPFHDANTTSTCSNGFLDSGNRLWKHCRLRSGAFG